MSQNFEDEFLAFLNKIPALRTEDNRNQLLKHIPSSLSGYINRDNAPSTHLNNIVTDAAIEQGVLNANGKLAREIVLENSRQFVKGLDLENELNALKDKYLGLANPLETIQVAVIAMTKQQADDLNTGRAFKNEAAQKQFELVKVALQHHGLENFIACYDKETSEAWQPFIADNRSIDQIINSTLKMIKEKWEGAMLIKPHYISQALLSTNAKTRKKAKSKLRQAGGLLIVDPISLYHPELKQNISLESLLGYKNVALLVLSPLKQNTFKINQLLEYQLYRPDEAFFDDYLDPICEFGISDLRQLQRWLLTILQSFKSDKPFPSYEGRQAARTAAGKAPQNITIQFGDK